MLLSEHAHLQSVSGACQADVQLPLAVRESAGSSFALESSLVPGAHINLMGTPSAASVPKVCVLVSTKRPGGIDAILYSLARQTAKDFELVMVDELWERERRIRDLAGVCVRACVCARASARECVRVLVCACAGARTCCHACTRFYACTHVYFQT